MDSHDYYTVTGALETGERCARIQKIIDCLKYYREVVILCKMQQRNHFPKIYSTTKNWCIVTDYHSNYTVTGALETGERCARIRQIIHWLKYYIEKLLYFAKCMEITIFQRFTAPLLTDVLSWHPSVVTQWQVHLREKGCAGILKTKTGYFALNITTGLQELHNAGFIHGDLKPDNILEHRNKTSSIKVANNIIHPRTRPANAPYHNWTVGQIDHYSEVCTHASKQMCRGKLKNSNMMSHPHMPLHYTKLKILNGRK